MQIKGEYLIIAKRYKNWCHSTDCMSFQIYTKLKIKTSDNFKDLISEYLAQDDNKKGKCNKQGV